ncbi:uncharacterized protein LOC135096128 [Scylla paramamosain]|uniref:uncharacterized protein LOC135096128 n=1 Tax=Scylla paramamosain TaxID=85552 RepID=UPI0030830AEA
MAPLHTAFILLIVGVATLHGEAPDPCLPHCDEKCTPGEDVPDPHDCHKYFTCMENCMPTDVSFVCPDGEKFDVNAKTCQAEDTVTCGLCRARCRYDCLQNDGFAAVRGVCNEYFFCGMDTPVKIYCNEPSKPYFDGTVCVADETRCCDPCEVYCEIQYTEIADPTSCKHFYYCEEIGFPLEQDRYECPEGETYNNMTYTCTPDAETECYQPCAPP